MPWSKWIKHDGSGFPHGIIKVGMLVEVELIDPETLKFRARIMMIYGQPYEDRILGIRCSYGGDNAGRSWIWPCDNDCYFVNSYRVWKSDDLYQMFEMKKVEEFCYGDYG